MVDRKEIDNTGQTEPRNELQTSERQGPSAQNLPSRPFIDSVRSRFFNRTTLALTASALTLWASSSIFSIEEKGNIQAEGLGGERIQNGLDLPVTFKDRLGRNIELDIEHGTMSLNPNPPGHIMDSVNVSVNGVPSGSFQADARDWPEMNAGKGVSVVTSGIISDEETNKGFVLHWLTNPAYINGEIFKLKVEGISDLGNLKDYSPGARIDYSEGLPTEVKPYLVRTNHEDIVSAFELMTNLQGEKTLEITTHGALNPQDNGTYVAHLDKNGNFITKFIKKVSEVYKLYLPMVFKVQGGASN